jgi:glucose-1-phosphate cytidylyltransferase
LGYRADIIKQYFLTYSECTSNDFVLSNGGKTLTLLTSDIDEWNVTFVDTGLQSNIGQRLRAVRKYLADEPFFLANYGDGLTDMPLPAMIDYCQMRQVTASFICVKPRHSFHAVSLNDDNSVSSIANADEADIWINGGYFLFKQDIFDYMKGGEELVEEPFHRLIDKRQLIAYKYEGFWAPLDTFKDKQRLDDLYMKGGAPWEIWKQSPQSPEQHAELLQANSAVAR